MLKSSIDVETIKEHLQTLGYQDIPEDILQELADELNESGILDPIDIEQSTSRQTPQLKQQLEAPSRKQNYKQTPDQNFDVQKNSKQKQSVNREERISREEVIKQLKALGYDETSLPSDVLDELVEEMNESLQISTSPQVKKKNELDTMESCSKIDPVKEEALYDFENVVQTVREQRKQDFDFDLNENDTQTEQENFNDNTEAFTRWEPPVVTKRPTTIVKKKRNDPVTLYHRFKSQWDKDSFLQRLSNPESTKSKEKMFGGIGYHAVMGGARVQPMRKTPKIPHPPFS